MAKNMVLTFGYCMLDDLEIPVPVMAVFPSFRVKVYEIVEPVGSQSLTACHHSHLHMLKIFFFFFFFTYYL